MVVAVVAVVGLLFWDRHKVTPLPGPPATVRDSDGPGAVSFAPPSGKRLRPQRGFSAGIEGEPKNAPEEKIASLLRQAMQGSGQKTNLSRGEWIALLKDGTQSVKVRRQAAQALAQDRSDEAMSALKEALGSAPSGVRSAIAESLGASSHPEANTVLLGLLNDPDEATACGAVRGVARVSSAESVKVLETALLETHKGLGVRSEAALALGNLDQPEALQALTKAAISLNEDPVVTQVLQGLGERSFTETSGFFSNYLQSPEVRRDLRVTALEALGKANGDPNPLLIGYINDHDPEARAAAAWAMSSTEIQGNQAPQLTAALQQEQNPEVRTRLYQALGNQENCDARAVLSLVQGETAAEARLAGLDLIASTLRNEPAPEATQFFDQTAVPELQSLALEGTTSHDRLASVVTLRRAGTSESMRALEQIAAGSKDRKVAEAAQAALPKPGRK